ncbi:MAG: pantoate--beta-alanine ligase [Proteobacteria bacterium]|nr:pantoate--beta-alanine ligase [Pseudomonadota bacterium]
MRVIKTIKEMQSIAKGHKKEGLTIGFVPTMGFLHEGHLTLVREAKKICNVVVVSIFVNPLQFGPKEDFAKYPRDFERDSAMLQKEGVEYIFHPDGEEMYGKGYQTYVEVTEVTKNLCGASRPGHFKGVTTVVSKLFNAVMPDYAFFGEKDYQQLATIKRMVADLNMDINVIGVPIVREADGLAMSSRNTYLSEEERKSALCLYRAINLAKELINNGERSAEKILSEVVNLISNTALTRIDYVKLCDPETLDYIETGLLKGKTLLALAVFVGNTRLIDNAILEV